MEYTLTDEEKKERGWFFDGKIKYYWRNCNFCGKEYQGQGKSFCSRSCSRFANPIIMWGESNPSKRQSVRDKIGKVHIGKIVSQETRQKISDNSQRLSGENHPRWIEDRSLVKKSEKKHLDGLYREWAKSVKDRDNWSCRIADNNCNGRLEAHHILNWVDYPELRYEINNGIALCQAHHPRGRAKEKRLVSEFQVLVSVLEE